jgi:cysteine-rich repeat protein
VIRAAVVFGVLAAATSDPLDVAAARNPTRASLGCRKVLGRTFLELARLGFREVDRCERRASKTNATRDCSGLRGSGTPYRRWAYRTSAFVKQRCAADDPVRATFPPSDLPGVGSTGDPTFGIDDVTAAIEASAGTMRRGTPAGARAVAGSAAACRIAIGAARTRVALRVMAAAVQCQRRLDLRERAFGMLDARCALPPPDAVVREAAGHIARACGRATGADLGTCDPLAGCAIDAAAATGLALARAAYGQCGNGALDSGEDCDHGSPVADECTQCRVAECGNGRLEGAEECDDGNLIDHDTCTQCRNAMCGDGIQDVGAEECDDENNVPGDGCTNCRLDAVTCSQQGVLATITFEYDPNGFGDIAGLRLRVRYPSEVLAIPGSLVAPTVGERVTNLTGVAGFFTSADRDLLPSEDAPDGVDDTLQTVVAVAQGARVPSGPFESIRFDCAAGTPVSAGQLSCQVIEATDPFTNAYGDRIIAEGTRCSIRLDVPPVP